MSPLTSYKGYRVKESGVKRVKGYGKESMGRSQGKESKEGKEGKEGKKGIVRDQGSSLLVKSGLVTPLLWVTEDSYKPQRNGCFFQKNS